MKTISKLAIAVLSITGMMVVGSAHATIYDFSVGFTNGPLNGQSGFTASADMVISGGELYTGTTNEWTTATTSAGLETTNTHFTVSSWFSFDQAGARTTGQEVQRIMLNDVSGGATPISAILRRGATDVYILQTKTDQPGAAANQGWQTFNSSLIGLAAGDAPGSSDDLYMSITFEKGSSADTWSSHVVLSNLTAGTLIKSESRIGIFNVTSNMHNAATYHGGVNGSQLDSTVGVSNRVVSKLEVGAVYVAPPTFDTVFDYDFEGWNDDSEFASTATGWDHANQWGWGFSHTNASGSRLVHRPASGNADINRDGWPWRGEIYTNGLPRAVEVGESLEFAMDYTMFAKNALDGSRGTDFFFTTNGTSVAGNTAPYAPSAQYFSRPADAAGQMGFTTRQVNWTLGGAWPDGGFGLSLDPNDFGTVQTSLSLNNIGVTNLGGAAEDIESIPMRITYKALKTETANVWDVTTTIANESGGVLTSYNNPNWTNAALYNATDIYFCIYGYHNPTGQEGAEIDNMHCRINYVDLSTLTPWEQYEAAYGLEGSDGNFDDDVETDWEEYVLGGDPTNDAVLGVRPAFDGAGGYAFSIRGDATLTYSVLTNINLVSGTWGTNGPISVTENDGEIHAMTNAVGTSADEVFMKLLVEQP